MKGQVVSFKVILYSYNFLRFSISHKKSVETEQSKFKVIGISNYENTPHVVKLWQLMASVFNFNG